jgi:hypothetical protein
MSLTLQYLLVAAAVAASTLYVVHQRAPRLSRRVRVAIAIPLVREGRPAWLRRLGRWLAPPRVVGDFCGGCDGCSSD